MDFLKLVEEARSCRRFREDEPLSADNIKWLVECARVSPSARNAQRLRFITVSHGPVCDAVFATAHFAGALKGWSPQPGERPTAYIAVLMPKDAGNIVCYDVGICCQSMQLGATSRGWGACMVHSFDRQKAAALLNPPEDMEFALLMAFGVAKEKRSLAAIPADGSTTYWRDAAGVHYVPKLPLKDLIIGEF